MDGNGRWAAKRGLPRPAGHKAGADNLRRIMDACRNRGIKYATFFAFSTENWKRPKEEVDALMRLFYDYLDGDSYREIAASLSVSTKKVDNTLQKIRKSLKKSLNR